MDHETYYFLDKEHPRDGLGRNVATVDVYINSRTSVEKGVLPRNQPPPLASAHEDVAAPAASADGHGAAPNHGAAPLGDGVLPAASAHTDDEAEAQSLARKKQKTVQSLMATLSTLRTDILAAMDDGKWSSTSMLQQTVQSLAVDLVLVLKRVPRRPRSVSPPK